MRFELRNIEGGYKNAYCVSLTLAAVTGRTPKEIGRLIHSGLHGRKLPRQLHTDGDVDDWRTIATFLGGSLVPADDYSRVGFSERPTIAGWMANNKRADLELVFCDDDRSVGHVFATADKEVVDTYTGGKRVKFAGVPEKYGALRVRRTFRIG